MELLYHPPLTREQIELLLEAVDDALPLWRKYSELNTRGNKLLEAANFLSDYIGDEGD